MSGRVHAHSKRSNRSKRSGESSPKPFRAAKESPSPASSAREPSAKRRHRDRAAGTPGRSAPKAAKTKPPKPPKAPKAAKLPKAAKTKPPKSPRAPKASRSSGDQKAATAPNVEHTRGGPKASARVRVVTAVKSAGTVKVPRLSRGPGRSKAPRATKGATGPKGRDSEGAAKSKARGKDGRSAPKGQKASKSPRALLAGLRATSVRRPSSRPGGKGAGAKTRQPVSADTRRNRVPLAVAAFCALVVLVVGFPAATLLTQHRQLSAASAQLHQVVQDDKRLGEQEKALDSKTEINRLARQDYQLVSPGQTLYDVLPSSGRHASTTMPTGGTESGDPGNQPLVDPANAPDMSPDPGLPQPVTPASGSSSSSSAGSGSSGSSAAAHGSASQSPSSFWGRVADTLEFWQ